MKPNLFAYATTELSQDAFIAWLLQWADPRCREQNSVLQCAGESLLRALIALQGTAPEIIQKVQVERQKNNIDVWARVNDSHFIIIEDKVATQQHSDQLKRYLEAGEKLCQQEGRQLICVYIKTHSDSNFHFEKAQQQGFAVFNREKLLELLNAHDVANDIYTDFRAHLRKLAEQEAHYTQKKIGQWNANDWKGLYQAIEAKRPIRNWGYVPNKAGGFWNLHLNWLAYRGVHLYMQIEQGHLCFKVGEIERSRRAEIRDSALRILLEAAQPIMKLQRPKRLGNGVYMTVAIVPQDVWLGADNTNVDIDAVLSRLGNYETWLQEVIKVYS